MKKLTGFSLFIVLLLIFSSCGKYEEGPAFSLRTKKMRVTGEWKIDKILVNDEELTSLFDDFEEEEEEEEGEEMSFDIPEIDLSALTLELNRDNSAELSVNLFLFTETETGKWEFTNSKEKLRLYDFGGIGDLIEGEGEIIRLTNSELWLRSEEDGDVTVLQLVKQ